MLNNIVTGTLKKSYHGYSIGATIYFLKLTVDGGFGLIWDKNDLNIGWVMDTGISPEIENQKNIKLNEVENVKFWTYYKLVTSKVQIPITFDLNFDIEE